MARTKIVATIGPASESPEVLATLVGAGLDVARLNASHSTIEELDARLRTVREVARAAGRHVAAMLDIQGPKIRLGEVRGGVELRAGAPFTLACDGRPGGETRASVSFDGLPGLVSAGDEIIVGDGDLELEVTSVGADRIETRVVHAGPLSSRKGITVRGLSPDADSLTADDADYVRWGLRAGVDLVAQSFVRAPADISALRELLGDVPVPIVAKIERAEALECLEEVIDVADAVMVARGDLALSTAPERVPIVQKRIVRAARERGRPVIVATQMLESMVDSPRPTRAEASDVANAVFDAVDAVMLSGETAIGRFPVETVRMMDRIACMAEESGFRDLPGEPARADSPWHVPAAMSAAVAELERELDLSAIVVATQSGASARAVASHRPETPIVAVTPDTRVARQLALVWGVTPVIGAESRSVDELMDVAADAARKAGCGSGDLIAIVAGVGINQPGTTDLVQVKRLG